MARTRQTPDTSLSSADTGNKTAYATRHLSTSSSRLQIQTKLTFAHNSNLNMAVSHSRRISHGGLKFPTSYRTLSPSQNKSYPTTNKPSEPSCSPYPYPLPHLIPSQPLPPKVLVPLPKTHPLPHLKLFPQTSLHPRHPHSLPPHPTPQPHNYLLSAPPEGSRFAPAQTPLMPVVPKHAQANTKPLPGVPAAMATAKHGSLTTLPSAHRVDTPCMPPAHSLRCPLPSAHSVTQFPSTSQIYNQYEACPLQ